MNDKSSRLYIEATKRRMEAAGFTIVTDDLPDGAELVGYKSQFRITWMATKLHLFFVLQDADTATVQHIDKLTKVVFDYAKRKKGRMRGHQVAVAVIPILFADTVPAATAHSVQQGFVWEFAAFTWPVVIDLGSGQRYMFMKTPPVARVYMKWLREQIGIVLPDLVQGSE